MATPEALPSPPRAQLEMIGAVLAGEGLGWVAEIAGGVTSADDVDNGP